MSNCKLCNSVCTGRFCSVNHRDKWNESESQKKLEDFN